jgi:hypothetical protein
MTGIEPATSGTTNQRSNQMSYNRHSLMKPTFLGFVNMFQQYALRDN